MKKLIVTILSFILFVSLCSCGNNKKDSSIQLNLKELEIDVGEESILYLTKDNKKIEDKIIWGTSNQNVATVYNGLVKGISLGETTISAVYESLSYECIVKVKNNPEDLEKDDFYGIYKANPYFAGMGMNMAFELKLEKGESQDTFIFKRGDVIVGGNNILGEVLESGNMDKENEEVFLYGINIYCLEFKENDNEYTLTGVMPTGAPGKSFNMTFIKEKNNI